MVDTSSTAPHDSRSALARLRREFPELLDCIEAFKPSFPNLRLTYLEMDGKILRDESVDSSHLTR